jgi:hypothetical protein
VRQKAKEILLIICLFLFLLVVIGGGLHFNPMGAFLAALIGTPLIVHAFNLWKRSLSAYSSLVGRVITVHEDEASIHEKRHLIQQ